jgi:hypothetical protein
MPPPTKQAINKLVLLKSPIRSLIDPNTAVGRRNLNKPHEEKKPRFNDSRCSDYCDSLLSLCNRSDACDVSMQLQEQLLLGTKLRDPSNLIEDL